MRFSLRPQNPVKGANPAKFRQSSGINPARTRHKPASAKNGPYGSSRT
jgi:hypothetical protein